MQLKQENKARLCLQQTLEQITQNWKNSLEIK